MWACRASSETKEEPSEFRTCCNREVALGFRNREKKNAEQRSPSSNQRTRPRRMARVAPESVWSRKAVRAATVAASERRSQRRYRADCSACLSRRCSRRDSLRRSLEATTATSRADDRARTLPAFQEDTVVPESTRSVEAQRSARGSRLVLRCQMRGRVKDGGVTVRHTAL